MKRAVADVAVDQDLIDVTSRLRAALGDSRGKIRVSDVQRLSGLGRPTHYRSQLVARALRQLGWERVRLRHDGGIAYWYAKGTRLQRETIFEVAEVDGKFVVKRRES